MYSILLILILVFSGSFSLDPIARYETNSWAPASSIDGEPRANNVSGPTAPETRPLTHSAATGTQAAEHGLDKRGSERLGMQATIMVVTTLVALAASLAMVNRDPPSDRDARHRARRRQKKFQAKAKPSPKRTYNKLLLLLGLLLILFLLFLALAIHSYNQALEQPQLIEEPLYTHHGHFNYTFSVAPSEQFVSQTNGQELGVSLRQEDGPTAQIALGRTLELEFRYSLQGLEDEELWIEINGELQVRGENGWHRDLASLPVRSFGNRRGFVSTLIEMQQVRELIDSMEEQTGGTPGVYELVFAPRVVVQGEDLDDVYQPEYVIEIGNSQIRPSMELGHVEHRTRPTMTSIANTLPPVLGLTLSVERARALGLYGALVTGLATMLLGAWIGWGLFTVPTARIAARYGKMLVEVDTVENPGTRRIRVQRIRDVARAAKKSGQPILHHESETEHMYCVADGENMYIYSLPKQSEES